MSRRLWLWPTPELSEPTPRSAAWTVYLPGHQYMKDFRVMIPRRRIFLRNVVLHQKYHHARGLPSTFLLLSAPVEPIVCLVLLRRTDPRSPLRLIRSVFRCILQVNVGSADEYLCCA